MSEEKLGIRVPERYVYKTSGVEILKSCTNWRADDQAVDISENAKVLQGEVIWVRGA